MIRTRPDNTTDGLLTMKQVRNQAELDCIQERLEHFGYRLQDVAESLDVSRVHLHNLRKKHGLMY